MISLGCPSPVGSINKRSGFCANNALIPTDIGNPDVQHIQPPATSFTMASPWLKIAPSIPTLPNSLIKMAHFSLLGFRASSDKIAVVFPAPRKPVIILVGIGVII